MRGNNGTRNRDYLFINTLEAVKDYKNVETHYYTMNKYNMGLVTGRNRYLDKLVEEKKIDVVFTVFGLSKWKPKVPHLEGFARCKTVIPESPYWKIYTRAKMISTIISMVISRDT